jgi:N-formylglutamate amidohydrolase
VQHKRWDIVSGTGPLVATAIHDGHEVRDEVAALLAIDNSTRLREEDPHTSRWVRMAPTRVVVRASRFEVDLNRPRERAVYRRPEDAWGIDVWRAPPPVDLIERSLALYDEFYADIRRVLEAVRAAHGTFVVFDLHTYNHRREGPDGRPADVGANPEVNLGTGTVDRARWGPLVDRFMHDLGHVEVDGRRLDVRENVKFRGGWFSQWIHETFPGEGCALAIEFKKFFMNEWTAEVREDTLRQIGAALLSTVPGVREELSRLPARAKR